VLVLVYTLTDITCFGEHHLFDVSLFFCHKWEMVSASQVTAPACALQTCCLSIVVGPENLLYLDCQLVANLKINLLPGSLSVELAS